MAHGFDNTLTFAKETTYGTASSTAGDYKWIGIVDSFEPEENFNVDSRTGLGFRAPMLLRQGAKEVDATTTVALQNARLIAFALGKIATTGDATAGYTHTITPTGKGENLPSFTAQNVIADPAVNITRNYTGGKIDSLTLTAKAEEYVEMEAEAQFQAVTSQGTTSYPVTAELENYFMFYEGTVKINNVAVTNVTEFELEIANNLERRFTLGGSNKPDRIEEGNLEITATLTMDLVNKTNWDAFQAGDAITVELTLTDVANPTKHSITITLSGGLYDTNAIEASAEDVQEQELEAVFTGITVVAKSTAQVLI
ncbi:hypothetical protein CN367_11700 [Priestia megaterium]|uniref:phage tail tube protein n=1 Tax=Priestia megaterium TaxID=1404 RepID=UPI000BF35245|nr:phage tail tube protein [Priestia megaterium]PEZ47025.1 hypothetical protein CN367_11700 [Priestia megaterium]